ncbi:MAG: phosphoenolpyruvate carboxylase, partial [Myxococcota bacterium]
MLVVDDFSHEPLERLQEDVLLLAGILHDVIQKFSGRMVSGAVDEILAHARVRRAASETEARRVEAERSLLEAMEEFSSVQASDVARALTSYFELVNLAEEHHRVRTLRARMRARSPQPLEESVGQAVAKLSVQGVTSEEMKTLLENMHIELVLTAHPTESKRRTVLAKLRRVAHAMMELERQDLLPEERYHQLELMRGEIAILWATERAPKRAPTVMDEVWTGLYYLESTLWQALPDVLESLRRACAKYYPGVHVPQRILTFGSWIGGDRDGNPYVTHETTASALRWHRQRALKRHAQTAEELDRTLSLS